MGGNLNANINAIPVVDKYLYDDLSDSLDVYYDIEKQLTYKGNKTGNEYFSEINQLIDFSGNNHHGTFYNFSWNETSGIDDNNYPNAIIFNGTNNYVLGARNGDYANCTMFLLFNPISKLNSISVDFRKDTGLFYFALYRESSEGKYAYYARNYDDTYINNKLNVDTFKSEDLLGKKHLVTIKGRIATDTNNLYIGRPLLNDFYDNMAFYKLLLFNRILTDKETNRVIAKYNLMDNVDDVWGEIE